MTQGWAEPDAGGVWTSAPASTLSVAVPRGRGALVLELTLDPQLSWPHARPCMVTVGAEGQVWAKRRIAGPDTWQVMVPPAFDTGGVVSVTIGADAPGARGVRLSGLTILRLRQDRPPPAARPCRSFNFGWNGEDNDLLTDGWGRPEDGYVWAIGGRSTLRIPVNGGQTHELALIDMRPFQHDKAPPQQRVAIDIPGMETQYVTLQDRLIVSVRLAHAPGVAELPIGFTNIDADWETTDPLFHFGKPFAWAISSLRIVPAIPGTTADFGRLCPAAWRTAHYRRSCGN